MTVLQRRRRNVLPDFLGNCVDGIQYVYGNNGGGFFVDSRVRRYLVPDENDAAIVGGEERRFGNCGQLGHYYLPCIGESAV